VVFEVVDAIAGLALTAPTVDATALTLGSINADLNTGKLILNFTPRPVTRSIGGFTNAIGTAFNDTLTGSNVTNTLTGNGGDDGIAGNGGDDRLTGGDGNDSLTGGDGNDRLVGNAGADNLTGGAGKDRFLFTLGSRFNATQIGVDVITDFRRKQDKLLCDRATFKGVKKISFESVKNRSQAQRSSAQFTYVRKSGSLYFNANGDKNGFGKGGQFADLANGLNLTAKDIILGRA
jgi:Ca2+-binding RTX toxin-like protein